MATYKEEAVAALQTLDGFSDMHPLSLREGLELAEEPIAKHYEEKARKEVEARLLSDVAAREIRHVLAERGWAVSASVEQIDADLLAALRAALASQEVEK
jgi:hypothetical protein